MSNEEQATPELEENEGVENSSQQESNPEVTNADQNSAEPQEAAPQSVEALQDQIEALKQEMLDTKDQALRAVADAQNVKRRAEKDVSNARKYALEKFASDVLVVADNLERALDSTDESNEEVKSLVEGVELTQKSLLDTLSKFKVEQLDPLGEPFDPQFHQAMSMVENPDVEPNSVTLVMQKGYSLNGRLLRPAMVMVAKAPANTIDEKA